MNVSEMFMYCPLFFQCFISVHTDFVVNGKLGNIFRQYSKMELFNCFNSLTVYLNGPIITCAVNLCTAQ